MNIDKNVSRIHDTVAQNKLIILNSNRQFQLASATYIPIPVDEVPDAIDLHIVDMSTLKKSAIGFNSSSIFICRDSC